jgi:hypothetical protein
MFSDPAKQQYFKMAIIIAFLISITLNFVFNDFIQLTTTFGFPFSTKDSSGIESLIIQSINTVAMGFFLVVPVYMFLDWLNHRRL